MTPYRPVAFAWALTAVLGAISALGEPPAKEPSGRLVLTTIAPVQLLTTGVIGQTPGVRAELLVSGDTGCPHDYALSVADRRRIGEAAAIFSVGLGLESFLEPLRKQRPERFIELAAGCQVIAGACNHDHGDHDHEHGHANPHVWMSAAESARLVEAIQRELSRLNPAGKEDYARNAAGLTARLKKVQEEAKALAEQIKGRRVAAGSIFAYVARDLGLEIVLELPDHDTEGIPTRDVVELTSRAREVKPDRILVEAGNPSPLAQRLSKSANVPTLELDTLFTTGKIADAAEAYETRMRANLDRLRAALATR